MGMERSVPLLPRAFEKHLQAARKALAMPLHELPFLMQDLRWRRASVGMQRSVLLCPWPSRSSSRCPQGLGDVPA